MIFRSVLFLSACCSRKFLRKNAGVSRKKRKLKTNFRFLIGIDFVFILRWNPQSERYTFRNHGSKRLPSLASLRSPILSPYLCSRYP